METFKGVSPHRPLNDNGREIRIIKLLPNSSSAPVECELEHIILEPEANYEAVSDCWGNASITDAIIVNGKPYPITILQEVSVRPKPYVKDVAISPNLICGDLALPFPYLREVDEYWVTNTDDQRIGLPPICPSLDRIRVIWYGHQTIVLNEEDSTITQRLAWILALVAARFHSTDQRDVVYATLGLLNADPLPAELLQDYGKSPTEILIECASLIMVHSRILTILQYNSMHTTGLPTWVPDWLHDSWCPIVFAAEPHSRTHIRIMKEIGALEVDIVAFTEVSRVGPQLEHRNSAENTISIWTNFFLDAEECLNKNEPPVWGYSSFGKALWQLLLVFDLSRQDLHEPGWHLGAAEHVPPFFFRERSSLIDLKPESRQYGIFLEMILTALETTVPQGIQMGITRLLEDVREVNGAILQLVILVCTGGREQPIYMRSMKDFGY
ncbi:hypothetical protein F4801DRAFT_600513 [Xylaria longipes]|nr:hypothetical protein F4801DRAFT_600513 [Xylaria longipes]